MNYHLYFLIHFARSGSTLLANELDNHKSIGVTLEENLPDGIKRGKLLNIKDSKALDDYLKLLYNDEKFQFWNVEEYKLRNHLLTRFSFPLQYRDVLQAIHSLYFGGSNPKIIIHKQGNYTLLIEKVKAEFPEAGFVFIDRDPRAIHNSQKRYRKSTAGTFMNQGIVRFALSYKRMHQFLHGYIREPFFYSVNYENFIKNKTEELQKLTAFLGVKPDKNNNSKSYYSRIPEPQKRLHQNVEGSYNQSRTEGWRNELENHRIAFLQRTLKKELEEKDYRFYSANGLTPIQKMKLMYWLFKFRIVFRLLKLTNWHYFSFRKRKFKKFGYGKQYQDL